MNETARKALIRTLASLDTGRGISVQNIFLALFIPVSIPFVYLLAVTRILLSF